MMKKNIYRLQVVFLLVAGLLSATSCNDWLDVKPKTEEEAEELFSPIDGFKSALAGVNLEMMDGVDKCVPIMHSYKLASREICPEGRTVSVGDAVIGGKRLAMMAGPCAVESEEQIMEAAAGVKKAGAQFLRV